jgi:hypothetical protein
MTIEFTSLQEAYGMLSDMHKDAYGFRPRNYRSDLTIEEIHEEMDVLQEIIIKDMEQEKIHEAECDAAFKKLVQDTINYGAGDEKTALKWIYDGSGAGDEADYFELEKLLYSNGIMHTEYGKSVKAKLITILGN